MSIEVRHVTSLDELRALGPRYDAMVLAAGDAGLFYQREWLERVWPYYQSRLGGTLAFLVAADGGELVGLAPLAVRVQGWSRARRRVLGFIGGTWDELDNWMPGFLVATPAAHDEARIMTALTQSIARLSWDFLELRLVRASYPSHEILRARFPGLQGVPDRLTTPRARLTDGWPTYWAGRSRRLVRILERGRKRAAEDGLDLMHEVTPGIPLARRGEIERIHRARQDRIRSSGRARNSPFEDADAQLVFWSVIDWATSRGHVRTHWLRLGERTAAYVVALHHAGTTFAYFNAIDPSAERYHPGSMILAGLIEREVAEYGATTIDMMLGANLTKMLFATEELMHTNLSLVNPRLRSRTKDAWIRAARALAIRLRGR